jgi:alpha-galactosidase
MKKWILGISAVAVGMWGLSASLYASQVALSALEIYNIRQDFGDPQAGKSVNKNPLQIGQVPFSDGVGTHANSRCDILLDGSATRFHAFVGIDAEVGLAGAVNFRLYADNNLIYDSGTLTGGMGPKDVSVPLTGVKHLILSAESALADTHRGNADWASATIDYSGQAPQIEPIPLPAQYIVTPKTPAQPKINGAKIVGLHPGHPLLYSIAATGNRPMTFDAINLPAGLTLDKQTGRISGTVTKPGQYVTTVTATNAAGTTSRALQIAVGPTIGLTPAMGWNPYNRFSIHVTQNTILEQATALVDSGLTEHGYNYVNIDDTWAQRPGSTDPYLGGPGRDANGNLIPNRNFSNLKGVIDSIHSLGLRAGIYLSPGPLTCQLLVGSYKHEQQDATYVANLGVDFIKYDFCSYLKVEKNTSVDTREDAYAYMGDFIGKQPRDIYYSLSEYGLSQVPKWGASADGNSWRTTYDITDTWQSMAGIGFGEASLAQYAGPGHWNDPDMLVVGWVGWGQPRPTRLTSDEEYTHISLWSLLSAPLVVGCDLTRLDPFTLNLLTNDEVIDVDQDPLGKQAVRVIQDKSIEVWEKPLSDGSTVIGIFNRRMFDATYSLSWSAVGLTGTQTVRDIWTQTDLGRAASGFTTDIPWHGVRLIKATPAH